MRNAQTVIRIFLNIGHRLPAAYYQKAQAIKKTMNPDFRALLLEGCVFFDPSCVVIARMIAVTDLDMNAGRDEAEALARALRGRDPEVIDLLIERYRYRLFRYLLSLTGHRQTAEDVFQETWIRVLERGCQYNGKSKFEPAPTLQHD